MFPFGDYIRGPVPTLQKTGPEFMTTRMNILFFLSKKRINNKGFAPIYCRITIFGQRAEFSTGISISPDHWNNEVLKDHPQSNIYNAKLSSIKTKLLSIQLSLSLSDQPASAEIIKNVMCTKYVAPKSFLEVMDEVINDIENKEKLATRTKKNYKTAQKNIVNFLKHEKRQNIMCTEVSTDLCKKFEDYYKKKKFTFNYINKHIHFIGQTIKHAIRNKIILYNVIPSYQFTKDEEKPIVSLTVEELTELEKYRFRSTKLQQIADLYLFQCYTGLAYCDLMNFDVQKHIHVINGRLWIIENRAKTNIEALIPIFDQAQKLLKKYRNKLPVISNQKYNEYIKEVAEVVGIEKYLTTHTARKTFAMIKLNEGFSIEAVSRMMGHNSTKITQKTYARVTHVRIDKELIGLGY